MTRYYTKKQWVELNADLKLRWFNDPMVSIRHQRDQVVVSVY